MKKTKTLKIRKEAFRTSRYGCRWISGNSKQRRRVRRLAVFFNFL